MRITGSCGQGAYRMRIQKNILVQRMLFTAFWLVAAFGFVAEEIAPFIEPLRTPVMLAADAIVVLLGVWTLRHKFDIAIVASYVAISYVSTILINHSPLVTWLNGTRVFIGVLFLVPVLRYMWDSEERHDTFLRALDKQAFIFLCIQAVCLPWQFIKYGACDHGGGSIGNMFSGTVSWTIYFFSFYLMRRRYDPQNVFRSILANKWLVILLLPTFLNETKISIILLALYFLLLIPFNREMIKRLLVMAPITVLVVSIGCYAYAAALPDEDSDFTDINYLLNTYLFDDDLDIDQAVGGVTWMLENDDSALPDIPRVTKIVLTPNVLEENPGHEWLGFGMGLFNGSEHMAATDFGTKYQWMVFGTNPYLLHIFLQLGIVGTLWLITFYAGLYCLRPRLYSHRDTGTMLYSLLSVILLLLYADLHRMLVFSLMFFIFSFTMWEKPKQQKANAGANPSNKLASEQQC